MLPFPLRRMCGENIVCGRLFVEHRFECWSFFLLLITGDGLNDELLKSPLKKCEIILQRSKCSGVKASSPGVVHHECFEVGVAVGGVGGMAAVLVHHWRTQLAIGPCLHRALE